MQCSQCYDEEIIGTGINRTVRKQYLEMESTGHINMFEYFQCPRCMAVRKKRGGFGGLIEDVSKEEALEYAAKKSEAAGAATAIIGTAVLLGGLFVLAASSNTDNKS